MSARTSAATQRALRLIARGENPHRAAARAGIAASTIYRALKKQRLATTNTKGETQ